MKYISLFFLFLCANTSLLAQGKPSIPSSEQFIDFLKSNLENGIVNDESITEFNQRSWAYWHNHKIDYNQNPKKYKKELTLFYQNKEKFKRNSTQKNRSYQKQIKGFKHFDSRNTLSKNSVLFVGSSSIAGWETSISFPELNVVNRGIGGISLSEIMFYYNDLIKTYSPNILVVYCDIDVERGKSPNEAVSAFNQLVLKVEKDFPQIQILLMAMKPTLIDDFLGEKVGENKILTNRLLMEYCSNEQNLYFADITIPMLAPDGSLRSDIFISDGMHLNEFGYSLWNPIVEEHIKCMTIKE